MRIAALDDESWLIESIRQKMEALGFECRGFRHAEALHCEMCWTSYDLLILDWNPHRAEGLETLRRVREMRGERFPILCLTHGGNEDEAVAALTAGADDFVVKPVRLAELQARVQALLRRAYPGTREETATFGWFRFFLSSRRIEVHGEPVELSGREFDLALYLFRNLGRLLSREHLLETVWGKEVEGASRSVDTHMSRLRAKLDLRPGNGLLLSAVYRLGYRLEFMEHHEAVPPYPVMIAAE